MSDVREIEQFIFLMTEAAKSGISINHKTVYANLKILGRNVVKSARIANNFADWIQYFKNQSNINVFIQNDWKYFCQFTNDDYNKITPFNMIKMYIPIDDIHINKATKRIFSFMAQNNMIHHSKIGSEVRFDDIVISIDSEENARKIEEFVMNDPYIKEGLMKQNPFAFNNGYISYAWDGVLSYNTVVSQYISCYINDLKTKNKLDDASYKGFVTYLAAVYDAVFNKKKNISDYKETMEIDEDYLLDNYEKVTQLLLKAIVPDKKKNDFFTFYEEYILEHNNKSKQEDTKVYITQKEKQEKWQSIYNYLCKKYGTHEADMRIFRFLETNDYCYFTRENNIREYLVNNNITKEMVSKLYLTTTRQKRELLANAARGTYQKYNFEQVFGAIKNAFGGYYKNFTNCNNGRYNMERMIKPDEIYGLIVGTLLEQGYDIKEIPKKDVEMYKAYIYMLQNKTNSKGNR